MPEIPQEGKNGLRIAQRQPWLLDVWEPLATKAPCPDKAQPYCCYIRTVIFYVRPYIVRPWHHFWVDSRGKRRAEKPGSMYEQWDQIETELTWDSPINFNGETFLVGGGTVTWKESRWWMHRSARRKQESTLGKIKAG